MHSLINQIRQNKQEQMYKKHSEIIVPNSVQPDTLPFFREEVYSLDQSLTSKRMEAIRNLTHKYHDVMAKIFVFFPKSVKVGGEAEEDQNYSQQAHLLMAYSQLPILTLENFTYLLNDLLNENKITKQEWSSLISTSENFKVNAHQAIDQLFMSQYQLKFKGLKQSLNFHIYFEKLEKKFKIKVSLRSLNFQISSSFEKKKNNLFENIKNQSYSILNKKIQQILYIKMNEKLHMLSERPYDGEEMQKFIERYHRYYQRQVKVVDEDILDLQIKCNIPTLRVKQFIPIILVDEIDSRDLVGPIFSNSNKLCMFGHLNGYNGNTLLSLENTNCKKCGIYIRELKRNFLLEYLRDNPFNPYHNNVLYCPEYNRFKLFRKYSEIERTALKLENMKITEDEKDEKLSEVRRVDLGEQSEMQEESEQQQPVSSYKGSSYSPPHAEIRYYNFMHLRTVLIKTYPMTRNRLTFLPKKDVQVINFTYNLYPKTATNMKNLQKAHQNYYKTLQLTDPARGKFCQHYQFADLKLFYVNSKIINNGFTNEQIFICPICGIEIKDIDLIYLKEMVVAIRYLNHLMEEFTQKDDLLILEEEDLCKRNPERETGQIIITHPEQKVYVQFQYEQEGSIGSLCKELVGLYKTMRDPFIHFSEYGLGLSKNKKKMEAFLNFNEEDPESDSEKLEKKWFDVPNRVRTY